MGGQYTNNPLRGCGKWWGQTSVKTGGYKDGWHNAPKSEDDLTFIMSAKVICGEGVLCPECANQLHAELDKLRDIDKLRDTDDALMGCGQLMMDSDQIDFKYCGDAGADMCSACANKLRKELDDLREERVRKATSRGRFPASILAKKLRVSTEAIPALLDPRESHYTASPASATDYYDGAALLMVAVIYEQKRFKRAALTDDEFIEKLDPILGDGFNLIKARNQLEALRAWRPE